MLRSWLTWPMLVVSLVGSFSFAAEPESADWMLVPHTEEEVEAEEPLETDRSAFLPATSTVGRGRLAVETSVSFIDARVGRSRYSFPELLVRYGVTDRLELRVGHNLERGGSDGERDFVGEIAGTILAVGDQQLGYGFKFTITDQNGLLPRSVVLAEGYTPIAGDVKATQMSAGYVFGWELANRWQLEGGLRFATNLIEDDHFQTWAASTVLRVPVGDKGEVFGEYFGIFTDGRENDLVRQYLGTGATYHLTPDLEVGLRLGAGLNDQTPACYANVGLGYRF